MARLSRGFVPTFSLGYPVVPWLSKGKIRRPPQSWTSRDRNKAPNCQPSPTLSLEAYNINCAMHLVDKCCNFVPFFEKLGVRLIDQHGELVDSARQKSLCQIYREHSEGIGSHAEKLP